LPDAKYAFISAYLKGAEAKVVTFEHLDSLSRIVSPRDVLEAIADSDVGAFLEEVPLNAFDDADEHLWHYFGRRIEEMEALQLMPADIRKVLIAYRVKYDVVNIKAALLGISTGHKADMVPVGAIHSCGMLEELAAAAEVEDAITVVRQCGLGEYADIVTDYSTEDARSRFITEARLDGEYYRDLMNMPKGVEDGELLAKSFSIVMDMVNLQLICRAVIEGIGSEVSGLIISGGYLISEAVAKEMLTRKIAEVPAILGDTQYSPIAEEVAASYGKTGAITAVEEVIERHKLRMLRELLSPLVMTPLMIVWYLIVKEVEIRNLRLAFKAAFDGIPFEDIKEHMVGW